jgi:DNA polymerase I
MGTTLLIDADVLVHRCSIAVETHVDWGDDIHSLSADAKEARGRLDSLVDEYTREHKATEVILALSDTDEVSWRKLILPTYKQQRKDTRKPLCFREVKQYVRDTYETRAYRGLEGDDVLGLLATHPKFRSRAIVVSIDKDLKTIPGRHWNPDKRDPGVVEITQLDADWWHAMQTLTGDKTDGYAGCPGVGPVNAEKILETAGEPENWWPAIVAAYAKKGLGEEEALKQARVARILRHGEFDKKTGKVTHWQPLTHKA